MSSLKTSSLGHGVILCIFGSSCMHDLSLACEPDELSNKKVHLTHGNLHDISYFSLLQLQGTILGGCACVMVHRHS